MNRIGVMLKEESTEFDPVRIARDVLRSVELHGSLLWFPFSPICFGFELGSLVVQGNPSDVALLTGKYRDSELNANDFSLGFRVERNVEHYITVWLTDPPTDRLFAAGSYNSEGYK